MQASDLTKSVGGAVGGYASIYRPSRWERFCKFAGFVYHHGADPEDIDQLQGWAQTNIYMDFGLADRLRLLLTGKLRISNTGHFDGPIPKEIKNRLDWHIKAPFSD